MRLPGFIMVVGLVCLVGWAVRSMRKSCAGGGLSEAESDDVSDTASFPSL